MSRDFPGAPHRLAASVRGTPLTRRDAASRSVTSILILGHWRSYSTLLAHLLGSNPEIAGHGELHISYRRPFDLVRQRCAAQRRDGSLQGKRYALDKMTDDFFAVSPDVLARDDVLPIFLVRRPELALPSIVWMGEMLDLDCRVPELATADYVKRLRTLGSLARKSAPGGLFIHAESIVEHTEEVLAALTERLGLEEPLEPEYRVFANTGKPAWGDFTPRIRSGRIVTGEDRPRMPVPAHLLQIADEAYAHCCGELTRFCETIG